MATWTSLQTAFGTGLSVSDFATDLDDNLYMMDATGDIFEYKISTDTKTTINTTASLDVDGGIVWFNGDLYMLADQAGSPEVFRWNGTADNRTSVKTLTAGKTYWLLEDGTSIVAMADDAASEYSTDGASWLTGGTLPTFSENGFPKDIDRRGNQIRVFRATGAGAETIEVWNGTGWDTEVSSSSAAYSNEWKSDEDFASNGRYWDFRGHVPVENSTDFITWTERDNAETGEYTFYLDEYGPFTKTYGVNGDVGFAGVQCEFCEFNEGTGLFDVLDTAFNHVYTASVGHTVPLINIPAGATSAGTYVVLYSTAFVVWKRSEALPETTATIYDLTHSTNGIPGNII